MTSRPDAAHLRLLRGRCQPDGVSCGASCVVAASMLADPEQAERLAEEGPWSAAVLQAHREITRVLDPHAPGPALPWPRSLGTPPWAAARRLRAEPGGAWQERTVRRRGRRGDGWAALVTAARNGQSALLCVGTTAVPRHFLLVLPAVDADRGADDRDPAEETELLRLWDPARGEVRALARGGFMAGRVTGGSFPVPWFLVLPDPAGC